MTGADKANDAILLVITRCARMRVSHPALRGCMVMNMVAVREQGIHIVPQYIHINEIWQV